MGGRLKSTILLVLVWLWTSGVTFALHPLEPQGTDGLSFMLKDLNGELHRLEHYRGKVVLINFWATWCPPCIAEMPSLHRLADLMRGEPFAILAISVGERKHTVQRRLKRLGIDLQVLLDRDSAAFNHWNARILPTSFLLDREGRVRIRVEGPLDWDSDEVRSSIRDLLSEDRWEKKQGQAYPAPL